MLARLFLTAAFVFLVASTTQAAKRIGLVIGNDNYAHVPVLEKARSDARAIAQALSGVGFDVTSVLDADRSQMNRAISTFVGKLQPGDTAFVFFAGHGVEIAGQNFLLPVNIEASENANQDFVKSESIGLSNVLARVQNTGARITLMFIDACRDNPFKNTAGRSIGGSRGLARITAPEGTFVVFSAGAGQQALDRLKGPDSNPNSVFTRTLLPKLSAGGLELRELVSKVRLEVREIALTQNHRQFPAYYDELLGEFYFKPAGTGATAGKEKEPAATVITEVSDNIQDDFERVRSLGSILAYEAFLDKYGNQTDILIDIAKQRLAMLRSEAEQTDKPARLKQETQPTKPAKEPTDTPADVERRRIIQASQNRLNALGCDVGVADGVSGPRTRGAFRQFISGTGANLSVSDFGSQKALDRLAAASGTVCAVAAPKKKMDVAAKEEPQPAPLAGRWAFRAKCPLAIRAWGTTTYRSLGGRRYSVVTTDNFKNLGKGTATDIGGGIVAIKIVWQDGANDNYNAKLSGDRRTITGTNYVGCRFIARKQN